MWEGGKELKDSLDYDKLTFNPILREYLTKFVTILANLSIARQGHLTFVPSVNCLRLLLLYITLYLPL